MRLDLSWEGIIRVQTISSDLHAVGRLRTAELIRDTYPLPPEFNSCTPYRVVRQDVFLGNSSH